MLRKISNTIRYRNKLPACRLLFLGVLLPALSVNTHAQLSMGGQPLKSRSRDHTIEWINLEELRVDELLLEDEWLALTGKKNRRIAKEIQVSIRPEEMGRWEQLQDGTLVWRIGLRGKGARSLGIVFSRYALEKGTRIYIYNPSGEKVLGAFTDRNNKASGKLAVTYLPGQELIVQMEIPPECDDYGELVIGSVRRAYLPVFEEKSVYDNNFGRSGDCNVDINCTLGEEWQVLKNSVVRLISVEKCTGVLINNTLQDEKAYVYTAAHCVFQNNKLQPIVFYFNYESPDCDGPDGSIANSISEYTLIATGDTLENPRDTDSLDFALLELSVAPPDSFKPYFAGWNRSTGPALHTTTIHHPSGDVKKIAVDLDPPETSYHDIDYFPDLVRYSHWRILAWNDGTTEGGSSGCPLFNQDQLIVGTLTGGQANCSNSINDYFTKFDYAWDYYPEPSKQIKHWLDPDDSGVITLQGMPGYPVGLRNKAEEVNLRLYPNPAISQIIIESGLSDGRNAEISICDISGRKHTQRSIPWEGSAKINVSDLPSGLYLLSFRNGNGFTTRRFIISR